MKPRKRTADALSAMCAQGKHGRCGGWMIVPNFTRNPIGRDISVTCRCRQCKHPDVAPDRHITNPPKGYDSGIH